jgi:uncharacterized membrane protein YfcA
LSGRQLIYLVVIFLVTSAVSVVTGSTSLITVPAMLQFSVEPRTAVATNMFALTLLSIGASLPLSRKGLVDPRRVRVLMVLTFAGSVIGAIILVLVPVAAVSLIVPIAMIGVALFSALYRNGGSHRAIIHSKNKDVIGYILTFVLGIYGGFFSGGYVTILTAVLVATFGSSFREAIATTKLLNICSSAIATAIFMWRGIIDYRLGAILGVTAFLGAGLGARFVVRLAEKWLQRIFLAAVWILGLKALIFDLSVQHHGHSEPVNSGH